MRVPRSQWSRENHHDKAIAGVGAADWWERKRIRLRYYPAGVEIRRRVAGYLAQEPRYYDFMTARETLRFAIHFFFAGSLVLIMK